MLDRHTLLHPWIGLHPVHTLKDSAVDPLMHLVNPHPIFLTGIIIPPDTPRVAEEDMGMVRTIIGISRIKVHLFQPDPLQKRDLISLTL